MRKRRVAITQPVTSRVPDGFTLVEALVSLVVFAIGLLALAHLYAVTLRSSTDSYQRTVAHVQAVDMGERMWLDLAAPLAQKDTWISDYSASLPGWDGEVAQLDQDEPIYEIVIRWRRAAGGGQLEYRYPVRMPLVSP